MLLATEVHTSHNSTSVLVLLLLCTLYIPLYH